MTGTPSSGVAFLCLFSTLVFLVTCLEHRCIHDEYIAHTERQGLQVVEVPQKSTLKRNPQEPPQYTQPLRIQVNLDNLMDDPLTCYKPGDVRTIPSVTGGASRNETCRAEDVLTQAKRQLLIELLDNAVDYFKSVLLVMPLNGPLYINSSIAKQKNCDGINIPPSYDSDFGPGVNAEYVLFVTSRRSMSDTTLAYARYCQIDGGVSPGGRPIAGIVNFAPYSMDLSPEGKSKQLGIILHEISHALGFSASKFDRTKGAGFVQWTGTGWRQVPASEISVTYFHPEIGHTVQRIVTPNTLAAVRAHFGCANLDGAELEDAGGEGTAGSHWEQRVFRNEYMTGSSTEYPVYSNITLSLFKDMGWYDIGPGAKDLDPFLWGRNKGCSFVNGSCTKWPLTSEAEGYRCDSDSPRGQCRFDMRGWAHCNKGEPDLLSDGCLFYASTSRSGCDVDTKLFQITLNAGEVHTNDSRCFHSTLSKLPGMLSSFVRTPQAEVMQCYLTACEGPEKLKVGVDGVWYDCPYEGGSIQPIGYGGEIKCNPRAADIICIDEEEDYTWPTVTHVSPRIAKPGDNVTIHGNHFNTTANTTLQVTIHADCPSITLISNTELVVTLPSNDKFSSIVQMGLYSRRFSVVIRDAKGRTGHVKDAILIEVTLDGSDIGSYFSTFGLTPTVTAIIASVVMLLLCAGCIFWCYRSWHKAEREHAYRKVALKI